MKTTRRPVVSANCVVPAAGLRLETPAEGLEAEAVSRTGSEDCFLPGGGTLLFPISQSPPGGGMQRDYHVVTSTALLDQPREAERRRSLPREASKRQWRPQIGSVHCQLRKPSAHQAAGLLRGRGHHQGTHVCVCQQTLTATPVTAQSLRFVKTQPPRQQAKARGGLKQGTCQQRRDSGRPPSGPEETLSRAPAFWQHEHPSRRRYPASQNKKPRFWG